MESPRTASILWANFRRLKGRKPGTPRLLTSPQAQPKTGKNKIPTYVLHLAPSGMSGAWDTCLWATEGCAAACLNTAGRGQFSLVQEGRKLKTLFLGAAPQAFLGLLMHEIDLAVKRHGETIAVRLNGTSDLRWERIVPFFFERWGDDVIFYDYTKNPKRTVPANYHLTYSAHERNSVAQIREKLEAYGRVAVVFDTPRNKPLPTMWEGMPVVDGDEDDQRWLDRDVIIGLRAKGKGIGDTSGFVRVADPTRKEIAT